MEASPTGAQLRLYAVVRELERRATTFEAMVSGLKRACVHVSPESRPELAATAAELDRVLQCMTEDSLQVQLQLEVGWSEAAAGDGPAACAPPARARSQDAAALRGSTAAFPVPDLIGMLSGLGKTGTLTLSTDDDLFVFELQEGRVVHAVTNQPSPDLRLGTILVAQQKISEEQLGRCLEECASTRNMLGAHLVGTATVSEEDLRCALDVQVRGIFDRAFALDDAHFTFVEGSISDIAQRTAINTTELLLDAARRQDDRVRDAAAG